MVGGARDLRFGNSFVIFDFMACIDLMLYNKNNV